MKIKNTITFIFLMIFTSGCTIEPMAPPDFPYELMLQSSDLPQGFVRTGGSFPEEEGMFTHIVGYSSDPDRVGKGISHQVRIYPDADLAKSSFPDWVNIWPADAWNEPDITYVPQNPEGQYSLRCRNVEINGKPSTSCTYIQQHKNLVIIILANVDSEIINYQQFLDMLESLDSRLPSSEVPMPSK